MKKLLLLFIISAISFAQSTKLFMPQPVKKAYEKGTRSYNGEPGKNYWLNNAEYKIKAEVNPISKKLDGNLSVKYFNNSPDTLNKIVMRLYPDLFKKGGSRSWAVPSEAINNGVEVESIFIGDQKDNIADSSKMVYRDGTNMTIKLEKPLLPDENISLSISWSFYIPQIVPIRTGAYSDTSMFVAYWYPQIAVYDDIDGWDELSYTGTTEMYNDFSSFKVEITLPKNYIMWSTGELQNPEEILNEKFLERYNKAKESDEIVTIIGEQDKNEDITKGEKSVWTYSANHVPDFAFGLAKNYLWNGAKINLNNGKEIFVDAGYGRNSQNFKSAAKIAIEGIKFLSEEMPGIPYPYPSFTAFNGRGGMEFPMIVNDGETSTYSSMVGLTTHELTHTYFPFYMGTNERRYAFMDEGMAVFLPIEIQRRLGQEEPIKRRFVRQEEQLARTTELPPMTPSFYLFGDAYRMASYTRSAAALIALESLLGKEKFLEALQDFMNEWNGKHPTPYDFFFTFNRIADEDLTWFWDPWYFEFHSPDLNLKNYRNKNGKKIVEVENAGGLPMPVKLKVYFYDNTEKTINLSPGIWEDGTRIFDVNLDTDKKILEIELGDELIPDINYTKRETISGD